MSAEKCPECGAWWSWPSEHRCPPTVTTNHMSIQGVSVGDLDAFLRKKKPSEPQGLGAVVTDGQGKRWIRLHTHGACNDWYPVQVADMKGHVGIESRRKWDQIGAVRVLSKGVTS